MSLRRWFQFAKLRSPIRLRPSRWNLEELEDRLAPASLTEFAQLLPIGDFGDGDRGGEEMGYSVAIDGDTAVIGATSDQSSAGAAGSAFIYIRSGGSWVFQQKLTASDGAEGDYFGASVSISGDSVTVGAIRDVNGAGANAGSAYVFTRSGGVWTQEQKLTASDAAAADMFGYSVGIQGDSIVVGARSDDVGTSIDAGSAYLFTRSGGVWSQQQKLTSSDYEASDFFGGSVAIVGDTVIVGASQDNTASGADSGSAYVFTRSAGVWTQQQQLLSANSAAGDRFGVSLAISGDSVVIGAEFDDVGSNTNMGSAYVFTRNGSVWSQQQQLTALDGRFGEQFGSASAISGDNIIIGAARDNDNGNASGSVYVFTRSGGIWNQQQKMIASDGATMDLFGKAVAISGDTILAGAVADDNSAGNESGAGYFYSRTLGVWASEWKALSTDDGIVDARTDFFGRALAFDGDTVVVGASGDNRSGFDSGSAYVYFRGSSGWILQQKLTASDRAAGDGFGGSVSISGDSIIIGAPGDDDNGNNAGSAYVFTRSGGVWSEQQKVTAADAAVGDAFGKVVAFSGDSIVVGAPTDDDAGTSSGSAYVFVRSSGVWTQQQKLTASDAATLDTFGASVAIHGDSIVVGIPGDDSTAGGDSGSAIVFVRSGSLWSEQKKLVAADTGVSDGFGNSVAISGNSVVVGASNDDTQFAFDSGSAFVFTRDGSVWTQQQKLTTANQSSGDAFGFNVAIDGEIIVVGVRGDDSAAGVDSGSAFVFRRSGSVWSELKTLLPASAAAGDFFGDAVAVSGETLLVGSSSDDNAQGYNAGAGYLYLVSDPRITSDGGGASAALSVPENSTVVTTVTAIDPDLPSGSLVYSIVGGADAAKFQINVGGLGVLSFVAAPNYEAPTDNGGNNVYDVLVRVNDGAAFDLQTIGVTIAPVNELPVIATSTFAIGENATSIGPVVATDADVPAQALTYSVAGGPDAAKFQIDPSTGQLAFLVAPDFETPTDAGGNNVYDVVVSVSDGDLAALKSIAVSVGPVNDRAPVVLSSALTVAENTLAVGVIAAFDADLPAQTLTYSILGGADASLFRINSNTGQLALLDVPDFEAPTDVGGNNAYDLIVQVSDGILTDSRAIVVTVTDVVDAIEVARLLPTLEGSETKRTNFEFGTAVAIDGDTAVVGVSPDSSSGEYAEAVYIYIRTDEGWAFQQKLIGSGISAKSGFGASVDISGDSVVVGSPTDEAVYVFTRSGSTWTQQQRLISSDAAAMDLFGGAVAIDGDSVVIGANGSDAKGSSSGAAYVFIRDGGVWNEQQKLSPSDGGAGDAFGIAADIEGDTLVVGATSDNTAGNNAGAAYVFQRSGGAWIQQQQLFASDASPDFRFGASVGMSDGSLVVGAGDAFLGDDKTGAAYVFTRNGDFWSEQQKLTAHDGAAHDRFGDSVDMSGDRIVVGAHRNNGWAGSAYVFARSGNTWALQRKLTASDAAVNDLFGDSVGISGDSIVVGAVWEDSSFGNNSGAAYLYSRNEGVWGNENKLVAANDGIADLRMEYFGRDVAIDGDTAVVGAIGDLENGVLTGSASVYVYSGGSWMFQQKLTASDGAEGDEFGLSVAIRGDTIVVGVRFDDTAAGKNAGSAYVFTRQNGLWTQVKKLTALDGAADDAFGVSVAIDDDGERIVVGAFGDDSATLLSIGSVYVFARNGIDWIQQQKLTAADAGAGDSFGNSVGVSGESIVVGARYDSSTAGFYFGSAYVFTLSGGSFVQQQKLTAFDAAALDEFGSYARISGDTIVVGSQNDDTAAGVDSGSAYVFTRTGGVWSLQQKLIASDAAAGDGFGTSVAITGNTLVVSAERDDFATRSDAGSAYVFTRSGSLWNEKQKLTAADAAAGDAFGATVALSGNRVIAGAYRNNADDIDSGSAYFFAIPAGPKITSDGGGDAASIDVPEGATAITTVTASNLPTQAGLLAYTIIGGADASKFQINTGGAGVLSFLSAPLYAAPTDAGGDNVYDVVVQVSDGQLIDFQAIAVTVVRPILVPPQNDFAPNITSSSFAIPENSSTIGAVIAFDADVPSQILTYSLIGGADAGKFKIDRDTGMLSFLAAPDFEAPSDFGRDNIYDVLVHVTDGSSSDARPIAVSVTPLNDNLPMVGAQAISLGELRTVVGVISAADFDLPRASLTYSLVGGADAAKFQIDPGTGQLSFLVAPDFEAPADDGENNIYNVFVQVSDGELTDVQAVAVSIVDVADLFEFAKLLPTDDGGVTNRSYDGMGCSVAIDGDFAVIGVPADRSVERAGGAAYLFARSSEGWALQQILHGSNTEEISAFGSSVGISGNTIVVGAPGRGYSGTAAGSAYVFTRSGSTWTQQQKLGSTNGSVGSNFGIAVGISGDTIVVGANRNGSPSVDGTGAAFVYARNGANWSLKQVLTASDAAESDTFGTVVDISGERIVVGSPLDNTAAGTNAGSAYVFVRGGSAWVQEQKLTASDAAADDMFGNAVAIRGDNVVIGVASDDTTAGIDAGSVYIFTRSGSVWTQQQKLVAADAVTSASFGAAVDISDDTIAIGANRDDIATVDRAGSAYVFTRNGGIWSQKQKVTAFDFGIYDTFGSTVAIQGDTLFVGATEDDTANGVDTGSVYIYSRTVDVWGGERKLLAAEDGLTDARSELFGSAVAIDGVTAVVGAPFDGLAGAETGSVSVYVSSGGIWVLQQKLIAADAQLFSRFGASVAIDGDTIIVGAHLHETAAGKSAGAAYVFIRTGNSWTQQQKLIAADASTKDQFGFSVGISGDIAVVGAPYDDSASANDTGAAYVFIRSGNVWSQQHKFESTSQQPFDKDGYAVAISGETIVVASPMTPRFENSVQVYARNGSSWARHDLNVLVEPNYSMGSWGRSVAISGDTIAVANFGSSYEVGAAYIFKKSNGLWSQQQTLLDPENHSSGNKQFGVSVAISGDGIVVGAHDDDDDGVASGSAYVYSRQGDVWTRQQKLTASDAAADDHFGYSVAISEGRVVVGSYRDDTAVGVHSGSVSMFAPAVPSVTTLSAVIGPTTGGTMLRILGANFVSISAVRFGGADLAIGQFTVISATEIIATAPAHLAGAVDVQVVNGHGTGSLAGTSDFTYSKPAIAAVEVNGGPDFSFFGSAVGVSLRGQHSVVKQIKVTFNQAVTVASDAFRVTPRATNVTVHGGSAPSTRAVTAIVAPLSPSEYLITFEGPGTHADGVIDSGIYDLTTFAGKVTAQGDAMAANHSAPFFALFGAVDAHNSYSPAAIGDGLSRAFVDPGSLFQFSDTFGSKVTAPAGPPAYNIVFDYNLDGAIDPGDLFAFSDSFGIDWTF